MDHEEALAKLKSGNAAYIENGLFTGDVSQKKREETAGGQFPYAAVVCCSDSRVIPEALFGAGTGELFVVSTAGNTVGANELGSLEYAAAHLGVKTIVILGHTNCGAVGAALHGEFEGPAGVITRRIAAAIGNEKDAKRAAVLNVREGAAACRAAFESRGVQVVGALYDLCTGKVEFL